MGITGEFIHVSTSRFSGVTALLAFLSIVGTAAVVALAAPREFILDAQGKVEAAPDGAFGIPKSDARFLAKFAGPIVGEIPDGERALKERIKTEILRGFEETGRALLESYGLTSDRERLIAYIMLRVNGSLPVYRSTAKVQDDLSALLIGRYGNCGVAATRLLMVLEAFSIPARAIVWYSPALTGHVFVDVLDPTEGKAYLLDPTFNLLAKIERVDKGFFDVLATLTPDARAQYVKQGVVDFPFFIVATDGIQKHPDQFREEQHLKVTDAVHSALAYELPAAIQSWAKRYPFAVPYTLQEAALITENEALRRFSPVHALPTKSLLELASLGGRSLVQDYLAATARNRRDGE